MISSVARSVNPMMLRTAPRAAEHKEHHNAVTGLICTLGAGIGLGSGATGGAIIGGSVATAKNLFTGLLAHNFTLATMGHAGLIGAGIGAVLFGIAGAYGGYTMTNMAVQGVYYAIDKAKGQ